MQIKYTSATLRVNPKLHCSLQEVVANLTVPLRFSKREDAMTMKQHSPLSGSKSLEPTCFVAKYYASTAQHSLRFLDTDLKCRYSVLLHCVT